MDARFLCHSNGISNETRPTSEDADVLLFADVLTLRVLVTTIAARASGRSQCKVTVNLYNTH